MSPAGIVSRCSARAKRRNRCCGTLILRPSIRPSPRSSSNTRGCAAMRPASCWRHKAEPRDMLEEARRQHDVEHGVADRHGERIAAEGRAVRADRHALGRVGCRETRAEREAAADALGDGHDVGRDAAVLVGEELAGATDAGLHLVEDQQQAVLVADRAQPAQEGGRTTRTPPSPWIGSIMIAAVCGPIAASTASRSVIGIWSKPRPSGRSPRDISPVRRRRASPACGRGTRLRR